MLYIYVGFAGHIPSNTNNIKKLNYILAPNNREVYYGLRLSKRNVGYMPGYSGIIYTYTYIYMIYTYIYLYIHDIYPRLY
jgi:hypothetical protein